jgi:galactokinase
MTTTDFVITAFQNIYGAKPDFISRAPGRVNIIGEHTDYNGGFVMPMALPNATWLALRKRTDTRISLYSLNYNDLRSFSLDKFEKEKSWLNYVKGVAWALQDAGHSLAGFDAVIYGDVPIGAGLSSSASIEVATAKAMITASGLNVTDTEMAQICQRAENQWMGVSCGIMDQMISVFGKAGHALFIDCRSLETKFVKMPSETAIIVMDTATRRELLESRYNDRRRECEEAAQRFGKPFLRDVSIEDFFAAPAMKPTVKSRAKHVIFENERAEQAASELRASAEALGELMNQSHDSLRDDFEVSSKSLDTMVEIARQHKAYGARMTGAGFAGCAIALVKQTDAAAFMQAVYNDYQQQTGLSPMLFAATASGGAEIIYP